MSATPVKVTKAAKGSAKSPGSAAPAISCVVLVPVVVLFFCAGILLGARFADAYPPAIATMSTIGLPGTNNIIKKWSNGAGTQKYLRTAQEVSQPVAAASALNGPYLKGSTAAQAVPSPNTAALSSGNVLPPQPVYNAVKVDATVSTELQRKRSLHATSRSFLVAPSGLDSADILIAAWIYLDDTSVNDHDMRTVFSNKLAGCGTSEANNGISMFVNAWQSNDHKLYVEYGGKTSGCHKVDSGSLELQPKRWYHVAVHTNAASMSLFVDGSVVNAARLDEPHEVQFDSSMYVGVYDSGAMYPFYGNISQLAVRHDVGSDEGSISAAVQQLRAGPPARTDMFAFYALTDAAVEAPNSQAIDAAGKRHGKYTFPVHRTEVAGVHVALVDGVAGRPVTEDMRQQSDTDGRKRRESGKAGMQHAWKGYKQYAWGRDEVKPISNKGQDNWGGMGVTLVDSLDTLWLMGMKAEFAEARDWVANSLSFDRAGTVSVFETTIRNGQPSGGWSGSNAILSELGSLQLEFRFLAQSVKERTYELKAMKPFQVMFRQHPASGLFPIKVSTRDGAFADSQVTFGALGDSFYEYLLKVWLQGGRQETWLREMYDEAMDGVMDKLLLTSDVSGLAFLSDWNGRHNNRKMDHLVCFMPGALALGAYTDPKGLSSARAQRDLAVAKALMYTCYQMYARMASGIAAEYVEFPNHGDFIPGPQAQFYILRPETAESLFILNKLTGDPIYRDWAWEIWQAIDRTCKTETAYGAIRDVTKRNGGGIDDRMESFFLAETLKYLYLAQDPDTEIDLMKVVFNTEAHPMRILDAAHVPVSSA